MSGMGFEPMNFEVSNLKFDALDHSANLTLFLFPGELCVRQNNAECTRLPDC